LRLDINLNPAHRFLQLHDVFSLTAGYSGQPLVLGSEVPLRRGRCHAQLVAGSNVVIADHLS
jgi:hypothetical protein